MSLSFSPYFALVPTPLYRKEDEDLWVNFLSEDIPHNQVLKALEYPRFNCTFVESIDDNTDGHIIRELLRIAEQSTAASCIYLCYQNQHTAIVCVHKDKLLLANVLETKNDADCLYYLTSTVRHLQLPENISVQIINSPNSLTTLLQNFYTVK